MNPKDSLPVILVSATDRTTAESFISELIDNEVGETEGQYQNSNEDSGRVWRLVNKYYCVDVEVCARGDGDAVDALLDSRVEAHVIYLTSQECEKASEAVAEARAAAAAPAVRVAALRAARAPPALAAWASRARYEPVALAAAAAPGPFGAAAGLPRVRAALHAHVWRGLRRLDRAPRPPLAIPEGEESSSGGSASDSDGEAGEAGAVARAERFARALAALGDARGGRGRGAERLERAEQLVAAFCRALGHDLDAC
ncbi:uncharacterized protein [Epargyreus clarus]|uniref:uncharacterized protein n=1 Tax=Epargyreus clarus TaxID=520877 RepID=UPI003C2BFC69